MIISTHLPRILDPRFSNLINPPPSLRSSEDRNHLRLPAWPSAPRWVCRAAPACLVSGLHKNVSKMLMGVCSCMLQCCSAAVSVSSSWCDSWLRLRARITLNPWDDWHQTTDQVSQINLHLWILLDAILPHELYRKDGYSYSMEDPNRGPLHQSWY